MAGIGLDRLLRKPDGPQEVSFVELFFDLALIFALTQLSRRLLRDFGWEDGLQTLIIFGAIWCIWVSTFRTMEWFNPDVPYVQSIVTAVMFAGLLVSAAVPEAFGAQGAVFAGVYVAVNVGRHLAHARALRGHPLQMISVQAVIWFATAGIGWIVGAFLPTGPRLVLWSAALVVDYLGVGLGWPVPGRKRVGVEHLPIRADHVAERHRQIFVVGLGELILASGTSLSHDRPDAVRVLAFAIAFAGAALMLWSYLVPRGLDLVDAMAHRAWRTAIFCSYAHGLMIAGIVVTATGDEILILHPLGETRAVWSAALLAGPLLYLAGRTLYVASVFRRPVWRAPAGMLVIAAMSPALLALPPLAVAAVVNAVLLGIVVTSRIGAPSTPRPGRLSERLPRKPGGHQEISFHELFLDLALVFALTRISRHALHDLSVLNVAQTLVLFTAVWWIWVATAWSTDWFNPDEPYVQRLVIGIMFAGLLMVAAVPEAFGAHGLLFAGAYTAVHIGRGLLIVPALRGDPLQARSARVWVWFGVSAVPWLLGALLPAGPRLALWVVAIVIDGGSAWFGWPVPKLGRVPQANLRVIGEHIAERYREIYIIAIGVPVLVSGLTYSDAHLGYLRTLAFAIAFANAVMLVWIYVLPLGRSLEAVVNANTPRAAVAAAYCHGTMIAGVVGIAVGDILLIQHPLGETRAAWSLVIIGGIALHVLGRTLFGLVFNPHWPWLEIAALLAIGAMTPGLLLAPPLVVASAVNLVALFIVVTFWRVDRPQSLRRT